MMLENSNSRDACARICLARMQEPVPDSGNGIYLGNTRIYNIPFLFSSEEMMNRNVAIIGMSGSGKSFLLKSILAKSAVHKNSTILIIDWNGEYRDMVEFLGGRVMPPEQVGKSGIPKVGDIASVDFSLVADEARRVQLCNSVFRNIMRLMRGSGISERGEERIIVLDEAWRLVRGSADVGSLFREGRKYRFSIIAATQLINDINNEIISNSASLFLFRMQNESDYGQLMEAGVITDAEKAAISGLEIGSCLVSVAAKRNGGAQSRFFIRRVNGVQIFNLAITSGKMKTTISRRALDAALKALDVDAAVREGLSNWIFQAGGEIDCKAVIGSMVKLGIERRQIVCFLRGLGVNDRHIAISYGAAASGA